VTSHRTSTAGVPDGEAAGRLTSGKRIELWRWYRRPSRWTVQVSGLALALAVLITVSAILFRAGQTAGTLGQQDVVVSTAKEVALDLSTISASDAPEHIERLTRQSTGEFQAQLGSYSQVFQAVLQEGNVKSAAKVTGAAVERMGTDSASVLVAVSAMVTNSQVLTGQHRNYRLAVQLQHVDQRWLASKVEQVG
jgi:Mce-associated membrane protein